MEITANLAFEELRHACSRWRTIGCHLEVRCLQTIAKNHAGDDERCLKEVLEDWLNNGKVPTWNALCNALEAPGLFTEAKQIREKYILPACADLSCTSQQNDEVAQKRQVVILLREIKGQRVSSVILGWGKTSNVEVAKGELLEQAKPKCSGDATAVYQVIGNKNITVRCEARDVALLSGVQYALLIAIPTPMERLSVYMNKSWMDWGAAAAVGSDVYIRVPKKHTSECCSSARIHYIGTMGGNNAGTIFGVEITDSNYYGCGSTDDTLQQTRYFTCPVGNGLFLPLASVAKEQEWLMPQRKNNFHAKTEEHVTTQPRRGLNINTNHLPFGTKVIVRPKDGRQIRGTIRWVGKLPLPLMLSTEEIPVYGVETDVNMSWTDFLPEFPHVNVHIFTVTNAAHGKVFIPVSMVEPYDESGGYDVITKSVHAKDAHAEVCAAYEKSGNTPVMNELMLPDGLGPEVVGDTNLQMQIELLTRFENERTQKQQLSSLQNMYHPSNSQYSAATTSLALGGSCEPQLPLNVGKTFHIIQRLLIGRDCEVERDVFMYKGDGSSVGVIKILEPMSLMLNYFEYEIINRGEKCAIGIGVGEINYPLDKMPGWNVNGIGYHADDGKLFHTYDTINNANPIQKLITGLGEPFGPTSTTGDRMGCGVDFDSDAGYGYVNIFFTRNGRQVGELIRMKTPTHGLYPLVGFHSYGETVCYLGHSRRVPRSISPTLDINLSPWLRSNGVRFRDDGLTVEYRGKGLQLDGHDVGVAQANITANSGNHYFEMEVLSAGEEGLLAIGFAEPTYPLHLYPGSIKGSIAYHTGHLYKKVVPLGSTQSMKCNRIGCGIQFEDTACNEPTARTPQEPVCKVFFIKDGEAIGTVECSIPSGGFYPFIAILSLGGKVRVNFEAWTGGIDMKSNRRSGEVEQLAANVSMENTSETNQCEQCCSELAQMKRELDQAKKELEDLRKERFDFKSFYTVSRHHVTVLEKTIGRGAWGYVKEGKFRGQKVAVKCIHETIITQHTIKRVYREVCSMIQLRHPNLVLFIAAVLDNQGGPMIITELLDTTLRKAYENNLLHPDLDQCMDIFHDVASALCYLHELEEPIIHRDVSSANVLLKAMANKRWKAKLSDFGSANWAKEASTIGEGAIVYTAPEAYPVHPSHHHMLPPQTTKMDVYSYGILLCEVTMRELPIPEHLNEMKEILKTKHFLLHSVVLKCTKDNPVERPTMATVLEDLN